MARFDLNDDGVVVIVGSGAGGGTLGNELAQKGVRVVILEAGKRHETADFVNDEWASFAQLAWTDMRTTSGTWRVAKDFPNLPAWIVKAVGGSTVHWAGASLRIEQHEFRAASTYGALAGANLLDWPITREEMDPWYARAEDRMGRPAPTASRGCRATTTSRCCRRARTRSATPRSTPATCRSTARRATAGRAAMQLGFCFQGCKSGAKWSTLLPKSRRGRRPAGWRCGRAAWR